MNADELAKERGSSAGENVERVSAEKSISELDQRIENQRREDTVAKGRAPSASPLPLPFHFPFWLKPGVTM
jgi:hypothetical protein